MRYINRINAGLEMFFVSKGAFYRSLSDISMQDINDDLSHELLCFRILLALSIGMNLRRLRRAAPDIANTLPEELKQCERPNSIFKWAAAKNLSIFFGWLHGIAVQNEQARVAIVSEINDAASHLDSLSRSVCKTVFALNNQRVFIEQRGDDITLALAERDWGRVSVRFVQCSARKMPRLPAMGYAFCIESKAEGDKSYSINILLDTHFSQNDYAERLLENAGWHELCFSCEDIRTRCDSVDYTGRMYRMGMPRIELIEDACRILVNKSSIVGEGGLTSGEQEMLPLAKLINGANGVIDGRASPEPAAYYEQLIIEALENRYAMQRIALFMRECGCERLSEELCAAESMCYDNHERDAIKKASVFAVDLERHAYDGTARKLLYELCGKAVAMTAQLERDKWRCGADACAAELIQDTVLPQLSEYGFEGNYPDYRRRRGAYVDYISLMTYNDPSKPSHGVLPYFATIAAARITAQREQELAAAGIPPKEICATDCLTEGRGVALYSELAGHDDKISARIDINLYSDGCGRVKADGIERLKELVDIAYGQFCEKKLPKHYRAQRRKALRFGRCFWRCFADGAPFGVLTALCLLVCYLAKPDAFSAALGLDITQKTAVAVSLGAGIVAAIVSGCALWISRTKKLWRF